MHGLRQQTSDRIETKNAYCQSPDCLKDAYAGSPLHVDVAIYKKRKKKKNSPGWLCFDNSYIYISINNSRPLARHWLINFALWRARRSDPHQSYSAHHDTDTFYV
jgi:hypothetical protein